MYVNGPERGVFTIEREPVPWYGFRYTVVSPGNRVATVTLTLRGARRWIKHRGPRWLEQRSRRAEVVERVHV